jgi:hypothetical protein
MIPADAHTPTVYLVVVEIDDTGMEYDISSTATTDCTLVLDVWRSWMWDDDDEKCVTIDQPPYRYLQSLLREVECGFCDRQFKRGRYPRKPKWMIRNRSTFT